MTEDGMNELREEQKKNVESQTHMFFLLQQFVNDQKQNN